MPKYSVSCKIYDDETQVRSSKGLLFLGTPEDSSRYRNNSLKVPDSLIEHLEEEDGQRFYVDMKIEKLKKLVGFCVLEVRVHYMTLHC